MTTADDGRGLFWSRPAARTRPRPAYVRVVVPLLVLGLFVVGGSLLADYPARYVGVRADGSFIVQPARFFGGALAVRFGGWTPAYWLFAVTVTFSLIVVRHRRAAAARGERLGSGPVVVAGSALFVAWLFVVVGRWSPLPGNLRTVSPVLVIALGLFVWACLRRSVALGVVGGLELATSLVPNFYHSETVPISDGMFISSGGYNAVSNLALSAVVLIGAAGVLAFSDRRPR